MLLCEASHLITRQITPVALRSRGTGAAGPGVQEQQVPGYRSSRSRGTGAAGPGVQEQQVPGYRSSRSRGTGVAGPGVQDSGVPEHHATPPGAPPPLGAWSQSGFVFTPKAPCVASVHNYQLNKNAMQNASSVNFSGLRQSHARVFFPEEGVVCLTFSRRTLSHNFSCVWEDHWTNLFQMCVVLAPFHTHTSLKKKSSQKTTLTQEKSNSQESGCELKKIEKQTNQIVIT